MRLIGFTFYENDQPPSSEDLAQAWRPYIETCIEAFGPQRSMHLALIRQPRLSISQDQLTVCFDWDLLQVAVQRVSYPPEDVMEHRTAAELSGLAEVIHPQKGDKWRLSLL